MRVVAAPALGNDKGLVEEVAEQDDKGSNASHAIKICRRGELGGSDLLTSMATLEEAGDEEPGEADEEDPPGC